MRKACALLTALLLWAGVNRLALAEVAAPNTAAPWVNEMLQLRQKVLAQAGGPVSPDNLLRQVAQSYPNEMRWFNEFYPHHQAFLNAEETALALRLAIGRMLDQMPADAAAEAQFDKLFRADAPLKDPAWLTLFAATAQRYQAWTQIPEAVRRINLPALRLSILELQARFPAAYTRAHTYLDRLGAIEKDLPGAANNAAALAALTQQYEALKLQALVADNPLVNFDTLLVVRREARHLGLPQNWQGNSSLNPHMENQIASFPIKDPTGPLKTIYKPAQPYFVGDMNLHFDAQRLLFSSIGPNQRWQVFEIHTDGSGYKQITPGDAPDIDNYNGIYLPDGRIIFDSTSTFCGVPCVGGADFVANLHLLGADGKTVRRLCFEQDNDWYPALMPDGRVLFLRWEYTDSAHYFSRILMTMNPDGTDQVAHYHSNSYWPNSTFYAKPVAAGSTKFVGVVSGHHGVTRMGELILFDVAQGRQETNGALQRIPGYGKPVRDVIRDTLANDSWPRFLHPVPLNDKYFIASCQPNGASPWGVYLVDVFDNMVLLRQEKDVALLEPIPLRRTPTPPVIPDRVKPAEKTATVAIQDIYTGRGLPGVARGTVKALRVFQYEYAYRHMGSHYAVGIEGPWDVRRIIGTVPVYPDGSAHFEIPANTPIALQPLDAEGKALQQMRSWMVAMPGEYISCTGCHDSQNASLPLHRTQAAQRTADIPTPWYGPKRGFSFVREVQPVLDKYCAGCHNGQEGRPNLADATMMHTSIAGSQPRSYVELHPFVRRNGPEGDYHTLTPLEFHADTSELVQMLSKGHYNVKLDKEAWDRLITWIDLNVPQFGSWHEIRGIPNDYEKRRYEMKKAWAGVDEDIEAIIDPYKKTETFIQPPPLAPKLTPVAVAGWPFPADKAVQMQAALGASQMSVDLGNQCRIELRHIPAGAFAMGDINGCADEFPTAQVAIAKPFWMATTEVTLEQFRQFDPTHRNGYYDMHYKDQVKPGYLMDLPAKPVIRVSCLEAQNFCRWLATKTGKKVTLPTEAQWEWACRAGTATPFSYGDLDTDFSTFANLADKSLSKLAVSGVDPQPIANPDKFWDYVPKDARFNDGVVHLADVGSYKGNPWGLKDMHGNVAEWTRSTYRPYPYNPALDEQPDNSETVKKTVRGGSWADRPKTARSSFRLAYPAWMKVYNVGFRIIIEDDTAIGGVTRTAEHKS